MYFYSTSRNFSDIVNWIVLFYNLFQMSIYWDRKLIFEWDQLCLKEDMYKFIYFKFHDFMMYQENIWPCLLRKSRLLLEQMNWLE